MIQNLQLYVVSHNYTKLHSINIFAICDTKLNPEGGSLQAAPSGGIGNLDTNTTGKDHG